MENISRNNKNNKQQGVTLIALVVTIVILIILAAVSISMIIGDNGIVTTTNQAKTETEKAEEKSKISMAVTAAQISDGGYEKLKQSTLQKELDTQLGDGKVTVTDNGDKTYSINTENSNSYTLEETGEVTDGIYDKWDGTSATEPTQMSSTEIHIQKASELKWLANQVNDNGNTFEGYTIYLESNLDMGAREKDGNWETSENEAVKWIPIGKLKDNSLKAIFEGNNHIIKGVYVNDVTNFNGIFGNSNSISNLTIKNSYIKGATCTAGIVGALRSGTVENCHNINTTCILIEGEYSTVGGVVGQIIDNVVEKCTNSGNIKGKTYTGGVVGFSYAYTSSTINNCYNTGTVEGNDYTGGVVGYAYTSSTISDCYNTGIVTGNDYIGGIVGIAASIVTRCWNSGNITADGTNGVGGIVGDSQTKIGQQISLCYNVGTITGAGQVGGISGYLGSVNATPTGLETKCYNKGKIIATGTSTQAGGVIGNMAKDANVTKSFYLSSIELERGVGSVTSGGDLALQNQGAQATDVDLQSFEEFLTWIEQQ